MVSQRVKNGLGKQMLHYQPYSLAKPLNRPDRVHPMLPNSQLPNSQLIFIVCLPSSRVQPALASSQEQSACSVPHFGCQQRICPAQDTLMATSERATSKSQIGVFASSSNIMADQSSNSSSLLRPRLAKLRTTPNTAEATNCKCTYSVRIIMLLIAFC